MADAKRIKLAHLGRDAHVSASGLEHLLKQLRDDGGLLPAAFSSSSQRRARQSIAYQSTTFGSLIQRRSAPSKKLNAPPVELYFQRPFAFLEAACQVSEEFRSALVRALGASNNHASIVLYTDEITPGQALQPHNTRKVQAVYWTLKEFGFPILSNEMAWMT
eukprot:2392546-Pyramimonas_sp.AAC.1